MVLRFFFMQRSHYFLKKIIEAKLIWIPWWLIQSRICPQSRRTGFDPWVRMIHWRREWQPTPVFLPGEFHLQRSVAGYSPWGRKLSVTIEQLHFIFNDLQCWVNFWCTANIYFFHIPFNCGYRTVTMFSVLCSRILLFTHAIYNSLHSLVPDPKSLPGAIIPYYCEFLNCRRMGQDNHDRELSGTETVLSDVQKEWGQSTDDFIISDSNYTGLLNFSHS